MTRKTIFISYSWDDPVHIDWVRNLADGIIDNGIDVILDQYDLSVGSDLFFFMQKAMTADKVVLILTPNYKLKADKREGGVGAESSLITQALYEGIPDQTRFIPVLRSGDKNSSCPVFMKNIVFHDMKDDRIFNLRLFELIKILKNEPINVKPKLGKLQSFDNEIFPDLKKTFFEIQKKEEFLRRKNSIINSEEGVILFKKTVLNIVKQITLYLDNQENNYGLKITKVSNDIDNINFTTGSFTTNFKSQDWFSDSVSQANVNINLYAGLFGFGNFWNRPNYPTKLIDSTIYKFDLDENLSPKFINPMFPDIKSTPNEIATSVVRDIITKELELRASKIK